MRWAFAAKWQQLSERRAFALQLESHRLVLFREAETPRAFADHCPHEGRPLQAARVEGESVICPFHGWKFRLTDGRCQRAATPSTASSSPQWNLRSYPCKRIGEEVWVQLTALVTVLAGDET